ncbi:UBP-type zinc finger domain-containing protein [Streptomyces sp. NPDC005303]|uniref:UBP-type zinc finger domain-containing protein n=1 Tax=Streptomyces sp. NPDC005303 TaxID=3155713 RepID=UPI0033A50D9D
MSETCASCAASGRAPADLLLCLTCGHVGCSDSSRGAHSTAHFDSSAHPVARTLARDRDWAWCYEDEAYLDPPEDPLPHSAPRTPESVWDYPRPPVMREDDRDVRVECGGARDGLADGRNLGSNGVGQDEPQRRPRPVEFEMEVSPKTYSASRQSHD